MASVWIVVVVKLLTFFQITDELDLEKLKGILPRDIIHRIEINPLGFDCHIKDKCIWRMSSNDYFSVKLMNYLLMMVIFMIGNGHLFGILASLPKLKCFYGFLLMVSFSQMSKG